MTTPSDNDGRDPDYPNGPSASDIERYNSEDYEYLHAQKRGAGLALWKLVAGAVFILFAASMVFNVLMPALNNGSNLQPERSTGRVTRVIDGHTITVEMDGAEHTVRYIGVQPPAFGEPFYETAIAANEFWLSGQEVELEADARDTDQQGRLLRYVWVNEAMVNLNLVGVGFARAADSGRNNRYAAVFQRVEQNARAQGLGIWSGEANAPLVSASGSAVTYAGDRS